MKNLLTKLALSASLLTAFTPSIFGQTPDRYHPSIGYHENVQIFKGSEDEYNPIRFRFGFEFDEEIFLFNKYEISPFLGLEDGRYDFGIDFKLKKHFFQENSFLRPYAYFGLGLIHLSEELEEQKFKNNFDLNTGIGVEVRLGREWSLTVAADYEHISRGRKLWYYITHLTTHGADNLGNPGLNIFGFVVGLIYKPERRTK